MAIANNEIRIRVNDYTLPSITTGDTAANPIMKTYFVEDGWVVYEFNDTVTKVPANFVKNCANVIDFEIPPTCTTLRSNCFAYTNITSAVIPTTVQTVEGSIFYSCKSLTYAKCSPTDDWGNYIFAYADQLKTVDLVGATYIPSYFFYNCTGLEQIEIPSTVTGIGNDVFYWNNSLNSIKCYGMELPAISGTSLGFGVGGNAGVLSFKEGADTKDWLTYLTRWSTDVLDADAQAQETVKPSPIVLPEYTYVWSMRVKNSTGTIVIPKEQAFYTESNGSNIPYKSFLIDGWSVYCLNSVPKYLSNSSFYQRDLVEIEITDGLEDIGDYAFQYNDKLREIVIPDSVRIIQSQAFGGTSGGNTELTAITFGSGLTEVSQRAFENHLNLQLIVCNAVVAPEIHYLTFLNIKQGGTLIYPEGSDYSSWLSTTGYYLGYYGWNGQNFDDTIEVVRDISGGIGGLKIPSNELWIRTYGFMGGSFLPDIIATDINGNALTHTYTITDDDWVVFTFTETPYKIVDRAFSKTYNQNLSWHIVEIIFPDGLKVIGDYAFEGHSTLLEIKIPDSVTEIGDWAFVADGTTYHQNVDRIEIGSGVTNIGAGAFAGWSELTTLISHAKTAPSFDGSFPVHDAGIKPTLYFPEGSDYSEWYTYFEVPFGSKWGLKKFKVFDDDLEIFDPNVQIKNNQIAIGGFSVDMSFDNEFINLDEIAYNLVSKQLKKDANGTYWIIYEFDNDIWYLDGYFFNRAYRFYHVILPASLIYVGYLSLEIRTLASITCYAEVAPQPYMPFYNVMELDRGIGRAGKLVIPKGADYLSWFFPDINYEPSQFLNYYYWELRELQIEVEPYKPTTENMIRTVAGNQIWVKYYSGSTMPQDVMYDSTGTKLELVSTTVNDSGWTVYEYSGNIYKIGTDAFNNCSLSDVIFPETLVIIDQYAFYQNYLKRIEIPNSVQTIGAYAFYDAYIDTEGLSHVVFGRGLQKISDSAFGGNYSLKFITSFVAIEPTISSDTFNGVQSGGILYVVDGHYYNQWMSNNKYYLGYYDWKAWKEDIYIMLTSDLGGEVEEETDHEFTVTYDYGRTITFDAPDEFIFNFIGTVYNGDGTFTNTYTLWVDSEFSEESATVYISDGISTIEKIIYITSDIDMASPSINLNYNYLSFPASGGTTDSTFTAEYLNTVKAGVNPPRTTFDDVTIDDYGYTEKETSFKQWHKLTVGATTYERDIPLIFSCVGLDGSSCTEIITAYQSGQTNPIQLTPEYKSIPASGGYFTNAIKVVFSNTSGGQQTTVKTYTRTADGTYVPLDGHSQAWFKCYQNSYGGDTTRTEYYDLKVNENTNTEPFMGVVLFRYTNTYGATYEREFYLVQDAGAGEVDVKDPEVQPYVTQLKITADGNNAIQTDYRTIQVNYQDCEDGEILDPVCNAEWFRITGSTVVRENEDGKLIQYNWVCDANTGDKARSTEIRFTANVGSTSHIGMVSVQQAYVVPEEPENPADPDNPPYNPDEPDEDRPDIPSIEGVYIGPIWKDVEFNFGGHEKVEYTVFYGPTLIFTGKAWKRPNDVSNKILVNKICQNYLTQGYLDLESLGWEINVNDFTLRSYDGSQVYHTYRFVNDWSYSNYFKAGSLYHPILENQIGVRGQMFPFSILGAGEQVSIQYGVEYFDGYTDKYGNPVEDWNSTEYITNGVSTDFFKVARRDADYIKTVWIGSNRFKLKESCEVPYVMYYLNPWGGFDWFPIQGKVTRKDRMTPYSYTKNYLNTNIGHGNSRYLSEIVPTFTLNTGWLKQIESDRMWYLLQSNVVYLHDLKLDRIYPVVITDQEVEYKQKTRTERILNYTFNVECAQTRERI